MINNIGLTLRWNWYSNWFCFDICFSTEIMRYPFAYRKILSMESKNYIFINNCLWLIGYLCNLILVKLLSSYYITVQNVKPQCAIRLIVMKPITSTLYMYVKIEEFKYVAQMFIVNETRHTCTFLLRLNSWYLCKQLKLSRRHCIQWPE